MNSTKSHKNLCCQFTLMIKISNVLVNQLESTEQESKAVDCRFLIDGGSC